MFQKKLNTALNISRMLKYLQFSSPVTIQDRIQSIREAFRSGSKEAACTATDYPCQGPELLLQQGGKQFRILWYQHLLMFLLTYCLFIRLTHWKILFIENYKFKKLFLNAVLSFISALILKKGPFRVSEKSTRTGVAKKEM